MKNLKNKFILVSAILALASCADNSYLGDQEEKTSAGGPISFGFDLPTPTRASGADAATALSNQFIVYGEKNETNGDAPSAGNLVFQNYKVAYTASTANTTTSNTNNWEYVGLSWTAAEKDNITTSTTDAQTIKFWDDAATSYTFTAISALPDDISNGRVKITKTISGTNQYAKGYSLTLAKTTESGNDTYPDLTHLYFADRNNIAKGGGYNHNVVTMNFRNVLSHVRVGIYETIPGYRISAITFYNQESTPVEYQKSSTSAFGAVCPNYTSNFVGTLTVTYGDDNSGHMNEPIVSANGTGTAATDLILGTNFRSLTVGSTEPATDAKFLGEDATNATYDTDGGTYTAVMPQTAGSNLKLKVNYTLYNTITKETINITGKTAEVPAEYLNWKANYKYTYLFKITDDDLNPITFDAAVIEDAVGNAEYITTVSEPSITTFGVTSTGVYSTGKDEYEVGTDIYATIMKSSTVVTELYTTTTTEPAHTQNVKVYYVTNTDNFPITEASVAESVAHPTGNKITAIAITPGSEGNYATYFDEYPSVVTSVPAEDGSNKSITAVKLDGAKAQNDADTYYAIEYTYTDLTETKKAYKVIKIKYVAPANP